MQDKFDSQYEIDLKVGDKEYLCSVWLARHYGGGIFEGFEHCFEQWITLIPKWIAPSKNKDGKHTIYFRMFFDDETGKFKGFGMRGSIYGDQSNDEQKLHAAQVVEMLINTKFYTFLLKEHASLCEEFCKKYDALSDKDERKKLSKESGQGISRIRRQFKVFSELSKVVQPRIEWEYKP